MLPFAVHANRIAILYVVAMQLNTDQLKAVLQEFQARYTGPAQPHVQFLTSHHPEFGLVRKYVRLFDEVTYQNIDPKIWGCLRGLYDTKLGISIDARCCRGILVFFPPGHRRRNCPLHTCKKFKLVHEECHFVAICWPCQQDSYTVRRPWGAYEDIVNSLLC